MVGIEKRELKIKTGIYTGNGTISHTIVTRLTTIKQLMIWASGEASSVFIKSADDAATETHCTTTGNVSNDWIYAISGGNFAVDDAGADSHPNKNGSTYVWMAIGY